MGLFSRNKDKINVHNYNMDLLKKHNISSRTDKGKFIMFMKEKNLKFREDKITEELINEYLSTDHRSIHDKNMEILKEEGLDGFKERSAIMQFMKTQGLNFNNDLISKELINQYLDN